MKKQRPEKALGYLLDPETLIPIRKYLDLTKTGDYGADPLGDGMYRMIPSGQIVDESEKGFRLGETDDEAKRREAEPVAPRETVRCRQHVGYRVGCEECLASLFLVGFLTEFRRLCKSSEKET